MIGVLFHGPEVFDSGWAGIIIRAIERVDQVRSVLAGTMGRTAAIDSGLRDIEFPGKQPSRILMDLRESVDSIIFANFGKSEYSGLLHGAMIAERSGIEIPLLQVECSGRCYVVWIDGIQKRVFEELERLGLKRRDRIRSKPAIRENNGKIYRRLTTAAAGEFLLVNGIVIGNALGGEVEIECSGGQITGVKNVQIKPHGLEKLQRLGDMDLRTAKVASTSRIRRAVPASRKTNASGRGLAFIDHAGMHVYDFVQSREGVVTVGDDTTAIVGDILYRFQIPLIGIVDGDKDSLLEGAHITSGSTVFTVTEDDRIGLQVFSEIFGSRLTVEGGFDIIRERISRLIGCELLQRQDY